MLEAKVGMLERIRRALGGSPPKSNAHGSPHMPAMTTGYEPHLEVLRDTARDLCADPWMANCLVLEVKMIDGKATLHTSPEALPYVKAAYAIKGAGMPANIRALLDGMAA